MKVDPTNRHLVITHEGLVHIQLVPRGLAPVQAVELAAWLVAMAECARLVDDGPEQDFDADAHFAEALSAIRNT